MIVITTLSFFLHFNFKYFLTKFKFMFFDYNDVNFNVPLCLLKLYAIFENSVIIE